MNISFKPIIISVLLISALFFVGGFLNDAFRGSSASNSNSSTQSDPKEKETFSNLDNIAKIEGQKITSINGANITLENGETIDFGNNPIKCQVGDIIENYTVANQSLICVRKDGKGNVTNSIVMPLVSGIAGGILGNYIASKLFTNNNGINRMPNSYDYRSGNGQVYNSQPVQPNTQSSGQSNRSNAARSFGANAGFGGLFGNIGGNSNDSTSGSNNAGNKSTGTTGTSKGGISTGTKGGTGGG